MEASKVVLAEVPIFMKTNTAISIPATRERTQLRVPGMVGVATGQLWSVLVVWEHRAHLESGQVSGARALNQSLFAVAMCGMVVLLLGVHRSRPGGASRWSRRATALLVAGWTALLVGQVAVLLTGDTRVGDVSGAVAGLGQLVGLPILGISVVRARNWAGWARWWPLGMALWFALVVFIPAVALNQSPNTAVEVVWALAYAGLGLALVTGGGQARTDS